MSHHHALVPGLQLQEYVIEDVLGVGGFGITYKATDLALKSQVAIKEYFPRSLAVRADTSAVKSKSHEEEKDYRWGLRRFISEARTLAKFKHNNIVRVLRSFPLNNTAYMVLEYVAGRNMESWLKEGSQPTQDQLDTIIKPLLEALDLVHQNNILHRDIKPANIYIRKEDSSPVLLDFGAARYAFSEHSASTAAIISRYYSPYESYAADNKMQGPWTDIYGMAATLYRAIRGTPPPEAANRVIDDDYQPLRTLETLQGTYRPAFLQAIDLGLAVFPKDRPQSIDSWTAQLYSRESAIEVSTAPLAKHKTRSAVKPAKRTTYRMAGLIAAAVLIVAAGFSSAYFDVLRLAPARATNTHEITAAPSPIPSNLVSAANGFQDKQAIQPLLSHAEKSQQLDHVAESDETPKTAKTQPQVLIETSSVPQPQKVASLDQSALDQLNLNADKVSGSQSSPLIVSPNDTGTDHHADSALTFATVTPNANTTTLPLALKESEPQSLDPDHIKSIQSKLIDKGCLQGQASGVWDDNSKHAWLRLASASGREGVSDAPTHSLYEALFTIEGSCIPPKNESARREKKKPQTVERTKRPRTQSAARNTFQPRISGVSMGAGGVNF